MKPLELHTCEEGELPAGSRDHRVSAWRGLWLSLAFTIIAIGVIGLANSGCQWIPSGLRFGGTPIDKEEKKVRQETKARSDVIAGAQAAVHQAGMALGNAEPTRAVDVATDFVAEAQALLDQAQGAPTAGEIARWQGLVDRLLSDNATIRNSAEHEREKNRETVAAAADKLAQATAARVRAELQVKEYARENEHLADLVRNAAWIFGILAFLYVMIHYVIPSLAQEFPQARILTGVYRALKSVASAH